MTWSILKSYPNKGVINDLINFIIARWWQKKFQVEVMKCFYSLEQRNLTRRLAVGLLHLNYEAQKLIEVKAFCKGVVL